MTTSKEVETALRFSSLTSEEQAKIRVANMIQLAVLRHSLVEAELHRALEFGVSHYVLSMDDYLACKNAIPRVFGSMDQFVQILRDMIKPVPLD